MAGEVVDRHFAVRVAAARVGEASQHELELLAAERGDSVAEVDEGPQLPPRPMDAATCK